MVRLKIAYWEFDFEAVCPTLDHDLLSQAHMHPKIWHSDADISDLKIYIFMLLFLSEKIKSCWIYKNTAFANWGKYKVSWNFCLVFIIDFQSCVPGSSDTVTSLHMEFHSERAAAGLGPSGLSLRKLPDRVVLRHSRCWHLQIADYIAEEEVTRSP